MRKDSFILRACEFVTKYSIYALMALIPIFFLPWTTDALDFNKQALLLVLCFVSLFALMLKILLLGKFQASKSYMHAVVGILFLVYLLATIFSVYGFGSFWGQPQQISESFITLTCLAVFYFLVSNVFSKKEIFLSAIILCLSAALMELMGIFQLSGLFMLPFDFAKSTAFSTVGSAGSLGFFAAILIPLATVFLIVVKKWWRYIFAFQILFSAAILFLVDYPMVWWVVIAGSALILVLAVMRRGIFDARWMALPMFFLTVSLFFVLLNPQINWLPAKTNEVFLSQKTSANIVFQSIKERPIFGSGPGSFAYDFSKFKDANFNKTALWNVTFGKSSSEILNSLATTGVLGFFGFLALMAFPIFYGVRFFINKKNISADGEPAQIYNALFLGLFVVLVQECIAYFLYNSNMSLSFLFFFVIAALIGLLFGEREEYVLKPSSMLTLVVTFIFTLVFIFGMGLLILSGQRYVAEINYFNGLAALQAGNKDAGTRDLQIAANLNSSSDLYFRQLSQVYLIDLQTELSSIKSAPSDQEKSKIQSLISNSINAAKISTDINPQDVANWSLRGYIYQNLVGLSSNAQKWALSSYDSALKLDPNNPYLFEQEGNVYLTNALNLASDKTQALQEKQLLLQAQDKLEKAVALNPSYSNALYSLGIVYNYLGQKDKAINAFTVLQQLNPKNTDIPKILSTLKAGAQTLATPPKETAPSSPTK